MRKHIYHEKHLQPLHNNPCGFYHFARRMRTDAILIHMGVQDQALLDIISCKVEPSGLLPFQMPANMATVEEQFEDVPRDMTSYTDSDTNTYDFAFGLNWSGVINDSRVATYK